METVGLPFLLLVCLHTTVSTEIYEAAGLPNSHVVNSSEAFNNIKCETDTSRFVNMNFTMTYTLINETLEFNLTTTDGYTVLHYSSANENVLEELLLLGTAFINNVITRIKGGSTVILKDDTKFGSKAEFNLTQKIVTAHRKEADGENVCAIVAFGNVTGFKLIVDPNTDPNYKDELEMAPMHWAAMFGDTKVIQELLERGGDVNIRWERERATPLHFAAIRGDANIVRLLVENGADIDAQDLEGMTIVHAAVFANQGKLLDQLIELGANLTIENNLGRSPLHLAAQRGYLNMIDILLDNGVEINSKDMFEKTPIQMAIEAYDKEAVKKLVERGASVNMTELSKTYGSSRIKELFNVETVVE